MVDLLALQKRVYQNKVNQGFNVTDVYMEFCYTHGELSEAFLAYANKKDDLGEELADVTLYLLGLAEILGIDLETEILRKAEINERRRYIQKDGVNVRVEEGS
jgi:uncharacterized protein YabN with tetrapyrrole methylase and pyrophosphatase domain